MARLANLNGVSETLPGIPKLPSIRSTQTRARIVGFLGKKKDDSPEHNVQTTRRLALGLASIALVGNTCNGVSLAEDNGFWITGPLPVPSVNNSNFSLLFNFSILKAYLKCVPNYVELFLLAIL